jgi:hypothetical protein
LKKNKNSLHKLPKLQSTSFWSQGILGVNHSSRDTFVFKGIIRTLLDLVRLDEFAHVHNPTDIFYDTLEGSFQEATSDWHAAICG